MKSASSTFSLSGQVVDVVQRNIFPGTITVKNGVIESITPLSEAPVQFILPALVDAHIHIESSMLIPSEFARIACTHGTCATVSDPHEIANVLGIDGVNFMIENGKKTPFKFAFGAPSCVPATSFETSGATITAQEISDLLCRYDILYLSEMMNFPGVVYDDREVMNKLEAAKNLDKPIDGHAPGLSGDALKKYVNAGISTDHECFSLQEAREKAALGMKILIREGSAAKNFDTLIPLLKEYPEMVMFCSDDKHPDDLMDGHINILVKKSIALGYNVFDVLRACTLNPVQHYKLPVGLLQVNQPADFIVIDNFENFNIIETYINGLKVAENGKSLLSGVDEIPVNVFNAMPVEEKDLEIMAEGKNIRVIQANEGQLITNSLTEQAKIERGRAVSDTKRDILKVVVLNRYQPAKPAIGFIKGFGLKSGAIASTVAHDSHNIIAVGVTDSDLVKAINSLVESKGGICVVNNTNVEILPLPVAGLMSSDQASVVAEKYVKINKLVAELGSPLRAPFMTLSFMALLVIPELKLSDKGLFDGKAFAPVSIFVN